MGRAKGQQLAVHAVDRFDTVLGGSKRGLRNSSRYHPDFKPYALTGHPYVNLDEEHWAASGDDGWLLPTPDEPWTVKLPVAAEHLGDWDAEDIAWWEDVTAGQTELNVVVSGGLDGAIGMDDMGFPVGMVRGDDALAHFTWTDVNGNEQEATVTPGFLGLLPVSNPLLYDVPLPQLPEPLQPGEPLLHLPVSPALLPVKSMDNPELHKLLRQRSEERQQLFRDNNTPYREEDDMFLAYARALDDNQPVYLSSIPNTYANKAYHWVHADGAPDNAPQLGANLDLSVSVVLTAFHLDEFQLSCVPAAELGLKPLAWTEEIGGHPSIPANR